MKLSSWNLISEYSKNKKEKEKAPTILPQKVTTQKDKKFASIDKQQDKRKKNVQTFKYKFNKLWHMCHCVYTTVLCHYVSCNTYQKQLWQSQIFGKLMYINHLWFSQRKKYTTCLLKQAVNFV